MGSRLAARRRALGLDPAALARRVETNLDQLAKWEAGEERVPPITLVALASVLTIPLSFFFGHSFGQGGAQARAHLKLVPRSKKDYG